VSGHDTIEPPRDLIPVGQLYRPYGVYMPQVYGDLIPLRSDRRRVSWQSMTGQEIVRVIEIADRHFDAGTLRSARAALRRREETYERSGRRWEW
jgi:hypothetical protein